MNGDVLLCHCDNIEVSSLHTNHTYTLRDPSLRLYTVIESVCIYLDRVFFTVVLSLGFTNFSA